MLTRTVAGKERYSLIAILFAGSFASHLLFRPVSLVPHRLYIISASLWSSLPFHPFLSLFPFPSRLTLSLSLSSLSLESPPARRV